MIRLRPLRRSEICEKDRASLGTRLAHISEMLGSLTSDARQDASSSDHPQLTGDRLVDALVQIEHPPQDCVDEDLRAPSDQDVETQVSDSEGEFVVQRVSELSDLIDAEFTHMWEAEKQEQGLWPPQDDSSSASADAKAAAASDRRRFPRHESGCIVSVCQCGQTIPLNRVTWKWRLHATRTKGALLDISMSGLALMLADQLPADEHILLRIRNPRMDQSIDCGARVVRTIEAEGGWKTVCDFQEPLTLDTIHRVARRVSNGIL